MNATTTTPERPKLSWPATVQDLAQAGYIDTDQLSPCTGPHCHATIHWFITPVQKKRIPLVLVDGDADGPLRYQPHFADCPDSKMYQKGKR